MSEKTKKVQWQVLASIAGRQWPLLIETDLPATPAKFKAGLESVSDWLLSCNIYPWLGKMPLADVSPAPSDPMPEAAAIRPEFSPDCPDCKKDMLLSKHQDREGVEKYYCALRTDNNNYCLWRASVDIVTGKLDVWQIKP